MAGGTLKLVATRKYHGRKATSKKTQAKDHKLLTKVARQVFNSKKVYLGQYQSYASITNQIYSQNLTLISSADKIFGSDAGDLSTNRIKLFSSKIEGHIRLNTEDDGLDFTIMIIRPKKGMTGWDETTGNLPTLTVNEDYYSTDQMVVMNPNNFTTLYRRIVKLFVAGTNSATLPMQTHDGTDFRFKKTIKHNRTIISKDGDTSGLVCPISPMDNVFLVIFNNNLSADGENPAIAWQQITTAQAI